MVVIKLGWVALMWYDAPRRIFPDAERRAAIDNALQHVRLRGPVEAEELEFLLRDGHAEFAAQKPGVGSGSFDPADLHCEGGLGVGRFRGLHADVEDRAFFKTA